MLKFILVVIVVALVVYVVVGALGRRRARPSPPPEVAPEDREDFLWQVRERAQQQRRRDQRAAGPSAPTPPTPASPTVTIDPAVFAQDEAQGGSNESFIVIGGDAAAVADALERVAARFMRVDGTGTEHPDDASVQAALEQGRHTPDHVTDPEPTARGPQVHVDCKGVIPAEMARTFHQILREELQRVGAPVRVSPAHA